MTEKTKRQLLDEARVYCEKKAIAQPDLVFDIFKIYAVIMDEFLLERICQVSVDIMKESVDKIIEEDLALTEEALSE